MEVEIQTPDLEPRQLFQPYLVGDRDKAGFIVGPYHRLDFEYLLAGKHWTQESGYPWFILLRLAERDSILKLRLRWTHIDNVTKVETHGDWVETSYTFPDQWRKYFTALMHKVSTVDSKSG